VWPPLLHAIRRCMKAASDLKWWRKYGRRWRQLVPSVLECLPPHRVRPFLPQQTLVPRRNLLLAPCHPRSIPRDYNKPSWASGLLRNRWVSRRRCHWHFILSSNIFRLIKSEGMRRAEHVTCMEGNRHECKVLVRNSQRVHLEGLGVDGRIILQRIAKKYEGIMWSALIWSRIGTRGRLLWTR
jgi:hypothetical protein